MTPVKSNRIEWRYRQRKRVLAFSSKKMKEEYVHAMNEAGAQI
jgi:hypothetical protein